MAVESWLWNPGCGVLAMESWLRNHGYEKLAVETWLWHHGCGILAVGASERHLGDTRGSTRESPGRYLGGPGDLGGIWEANVFKHLCFTSQKGVTDHFACTGRA